MAGPDAWDVKLKEIINRISYGNNPKTKILVMSDDVARDKEKIGVLKTSTKVGFAPVLDLKKEKHLWRNGEEEFLNKVFESKPTVIVVASADHGAKVVKNGEVGYKFKPWKDMQGTVFEPLRRNYRIDKELLAYREKSFVICEPWDVYHLEGGCLLSSIVTLSGGGLFREWKTLINDGKIKNGDKIAIIEGFHGSNRTADWAPIPYGGVSAFTGPIRHLDYSFYIETCDNLYINPTKRAKDPLNYGDTIRDSRKGPPPDREEFPISSIDDDTWKEYGENANPKPTWQTVHANMLGCEKDVEMQAAVFNLAYYHKDTARLRYYDNKKMGDDNLIRVLIEYLLKNGCFDSFSKRPGLNMIAKLAEIQDDRVFKTLIPDKKASTIEEIRKDILHVKDRFTKKIEAREMTRLVEVKELLERDIFTTLAKFGNNEDEVYDKVIRALIPDKDTNTYDNVREAIKGLDAFKYDHLHRLIKDLKGLKGLPTHFFNATCYSSNNDLAIAMRATDDIFSTMLLNRDIQAITGNPEAKISKEQEAFLNSAIKDENKHIMVAGHKGSGKTLIAAEIAKAKIAKAIKSGQKKIKLIVRLHGPIYGGGVPSQLATDFETRYLDGFQPEIKNLHILEYQEGTRIADKIQHDPEIVRGKFLRQFNHQKPFHNWITKEFNTPADETVVMLLDDMLLKDLRDLELENLNGSVICCTSQVREMLDHEEHWNNKGWCIPNDGQGKYIKLEKSYRYTPKIAQFLQDQGEYRGESVSLPDDESRCPRPLSVTEHPVIWLEVSDGRPSNELDFEQTLLRMRDVVLSKLPDEEKGDDRSVFCIRDDGLMVARGSLSPAHGAEADIVIREGFFYNIEYYSRARKQLFIVTYWNERDPWTKETERLPQWKVMHSLLNPALETRLVKKDVTFAELQDERWWDKVKN